jgi:PAS domain S-box-containing protein
MGGVGAAPARKRLRYATRGRDRRGGRAGASTVPNGRVSAGLRRSLTPAIRFIQRQDPFIRPPGRLYSRIGPRTINMFIRDRYAEEAMAGTWKSLPASVPQDHRKVAGTMDSNGDREQQGDRRAVEERALWLAVDGIQDYAILMLDADGRVMTWNRGAERIKGYSARDIIGQHFSRFYPDEDLRAGKCERELEIASRDGRFEDEGWRVRKDGARFWANVVITAVHRPEGGLYGFVKVTRDLTERMKAEQQRVALIEQLKRSNQDLQEFAMVASHDLQEPLRKVQMFAESLVEEYASRLDDTFRDYLERMQKAAHRGQSLIQGLLTYSRVTTRVQPPTPIQLREVAREVLQDLDSRAASVRGTVRVGDLPTLEADPLQMRQLFQNLIGNALKFSREGVPPVVEVSASKLEGDHESPRWRLVVADNGIGFDEKYLDRIFKLFQRLHDRGVYEGSGMGLAICRKIVERHGGTITASSRPGVGTRFAVDLPEQQLPLEAQP